MDGLRDDDLMVLGVYLEPQNSERLDLQVHMVVLSQGAAVKGG
jgi:hypothetical protein